MILASGELLMGGMADPRCRAVVALPARNEEASLAATLDALAAQVDSAGEPLALRSFEILALLNNCTDRSAAVVRSWQHEHPEVVLHCCERELPKEVAHIGEVRRLLMNTACHRLSACRETCAILSTDSDSYAAPDWIAQTLLAIEKGADAVGGAICLIRNDHESLPATVQRAYRNDRRYQLLVAEMEDLFDPQPGDAWPRHLEHFGASLACTPEVYQRAGGMPSTAELEDVAFVDRLRRVDARLRHEPAVVVYTSARLSGRIATGLAGQLRRWQEMAEVGREHRVLSASWLRHRFQTLRSLRRFHASNDVTYLQKMPTLWQLRVDEVRTRETGIGHFLAALDCDRLMEESFVGQREGEVGAVNEAITRIIQIERERRTDIADTVELMRAR